MPEAPARTPKKAPLKIWTDWSAGIGFAKDGEADGMYYSSGLLGLRGELRPAPFKNTVAVGIDSAQHYQYFFEEPVAGQVPVHDANSSGTISNDSTVTIPHTVAAQPNRVLLAWVFSSWGFASDTPIATLTYNGVSLSLKAQASNSTGGTTAFRADLYVLPAPSAGAAYNFVYTVTNGTVVDAVIVLSSWYNVSQSAPLGALGGSFGTGTSISKTGINSSTSEFMLFGSATPFNVTDTKDAAETLIATAINAGNDMRGTASYKVGSPGGSMTHTLSLSREWVYVVASLIGVSPGPSHLYAMSGGKSATTIARLYKVDLFNSAFGTLESGSYALTNLLKCGQPTRYQGFWYVPDGNAFDPRKLTPALGAPSAELAVSSAWTGGGTDHLGNMGGQMIAGLVNNGFAILKVDGVPTTTTDWGSYFQVGDKNERAAAIAGLAGASFSLTVEGLFSFNKVGRSGLVFEDFRSWRNVFDNIPMPTWKGGLIIPHPTGLVRYDRSDLPQNVGIELRGGVSGLPPGGVTELQGGRYMGTHGVGDYLYAIYQPRVSSTACLVLCAYSPTGDPYELVWQTIGTTTLQDAQHLLGIFVSAQSQPLSSTYFTPVMWFGDEDDLSYIVLDQRAGPFRPRSDPHKVAQSASAVMSEVFFEQPVDLGEVVVYTQDMVANDEWQLSCIVNATGNETNIGKPFVGGGRDSRPLNYERVHRLTLIVTFTTTDTSARVSPSISRIELFGRVS